MHHVGHLPRITIFIVRTIILVFLALRHFVLRVRAVSSPHLCRRTGYTFWIFSWYPSVPTGKFRNVISTWATKEFFQVFPNHQSLITATKRRRTEWSLTKMKGRNNRCIIWGSSLVLAWREWRKPHESASQYSRRNARDQIITSPAWNPEEMLPKGVDLVCNC